MGCLLGVGALALGLLVAAGPTARPLGLAGPDRQAKELVGVVFRDGATVSCSLQDGAGRRRSKA